MPNKGPDLGPVEAFGIEVTSFAESSNPATTNVTIRSNKIKLGPGNAGILNAAAAGLGDIVTGAPYEPPYFPGSNVAVG